MKDNYNYSCEPCKNCRGGMHCYKDSSPCSGTWCGIYPGTGPWREEDDEERKEETK